jgi:hypothetical protein
MEGMLSAACGAVFTVAWWIFVVAMFYTVAEMVAIAMFVPFAFTTGKVLIRIEEPLIVRPAAIPPKGVTPHASFRVINPKRCLFRESGPSLFLFRMWGLFFLKGTIDLSDGRAVTVGRLALGPTILYTAFLVAWTAGALGKLLQDGGPALGGVMIFLLLGWGILGLIAIPSIGFAKRKFYRAYEEVKGALQPTIWL